MKNKIFLAAISIAAFLLAGFTTGFAMQQETDTDFAKKLFPKKKRSLFFTEN
jgi:hypothetical protein